jgi:ribosomal protein S18 acetylase RimI-like enzyme
MIELRPVNKEDERFIEKVYRSTREEELNFTNWPEEQKQAFMMMQSMAQEAEYKTKFPGAEFQIILYKKQEAGRMYTWEGEKEIRLIDITLLPEFRGKGIGAFLLRELIKRSGILEKKISLHVDPLNPALKLYMHAGFKHISNNKRYYYMEREPS